MLLHYSPLLRIYFGDARDQLKNSEYLSLPDQPILTLEPFCRLKKLMKLEQLVFLHQQHSDHGFALNSPEAVEALVPFKQDGDYLITNQPGVGIGVMTGDCLPLIIHDGFNNVVAAVHAGWKGSFAQIGPKVLAHMQQEFNTDLADVKIFFGPSAKPCCYEVKEDFLAHLEAFTFGEQVLQRYGDQIMFDLPTFNRLVFEGLGIKKDAFSFDYNRCTMCDPAFYSHRRHADVGGRQMTVVNLT